MHSKILALLLLFSCLNISDAAVFPTGPSLTVGGRVFTDLTNLLTFACWATGTGSTFGPCVKTGGTAGYQVTSGKTLTIYAVLCSPDATGSVGFNLLYADTVVANGGSNSAPTNPIYFGGGGQTQGNFEMQSGAVGVQSSFAPNFQAPSTKYLSVYNNGAGNAHCLAYGYEQ